MDFTAVVPFLAQAFPAAMPYLAAVPLVQLAASALANIPRLAGVTHSTLWSRFWTAVATAHVIPTPTVGGTSVLALRAPKMQGAAQLQPLAPPRGFAPVRTLLFVGALTLIVVTGIRCAAVRSGLQTVEGAPVKEACFTFDPPVMDSTGTKRCTQLCIGTDPPSAVWACQEVKP